jgi:Fic-DOC domain mobile mystery protein B
MGLGEDANDATPLDPDEAAGLLPSHISTQDELNEWEQANILNAQRWLTTARGVEILGEDTIRELHRKMFGDTWEWAGEFRRSDKNIGVPWFQVPIALRELLRDVAYWRDNSVYTPDEIAVRFHHRLVQIHLFPNGNGRHARIATDLLLDQLKTPRFSWGGGALTKPTETRATYISALKAADRNDIGPLLLFVRT